MKVLKFGGTSIRDAEWINKVLDIAIGGISDAQAIVLSAIADTTNQLQSMGEEAEQGLPPHVLLQTRPRFMHSDWSWAWVTPGSTTACIFF